MTDHQPNDLEGRIRDAYQSAARTVQTLQRPSPVRAAGPVRRPRRMNVLAPIVVAAAVIVVIAASVPCRACWPAPPGTRRSRRSARPRITRRSRSW